MFEELIDYINSLARTIDDLGSAAPKKMGFLLHSTNHATGLIYHSKTKHWAFMDINQWPPSVHKTDTLEAMSTSIMQGFNGRESTATEVCFAAYPIAPKQVLDSIPQLATKLAKQCPPQGITADLMQRKEFPTFIHLACQCDNPEVIKAAHNVYYLNGTVQAGLTLLVVACLHNARKVIDALHECDVNFEQHSETGSRAIDTAARRSSPEVLRALIKYTKSAENTALPREAASTNNAQVIEVFKEFQIDLDQQDEVGNTALHIAVYNNYLETVTALIDNGADLNIQDHYGDTPLHLATRLGLLTQCAIILIKAGAQLDIANKNGDVPLHLAATYGKLDILLELLPSKIGLNVQNHKGQTPIGVATSQSCGVQDTLIVMSLLAYDADLDIPNHQGETPLIIATKRSNNKLIHAFLEKEADVNSVDNEGNSALLIAAADTDKACITRFSLLLDHGANPNLANAKGETAGIIAIDCYSRPASLRKLNALFKYDVDLFHITAAGKTTFSLAREMKDLSIFCQLMAYQCQKITPLLCQALNQNNVKFALAVLVVIGAVYASQDANQTTNIFTFFDGAQSLVGNTPESAQDILIPKKT